MKEKQKKNQGITLITLVITIIVLLILAGVTIATLTGDNGLITKADEAKNATDIGKEKEEIGLAMLKASTENKYGNVDKDKFQRALGTGSTVEKYGKNFLVTLNNSRQYRVYANGNIELYEYELMDLTDVYGKIENGVLYLRSSYKDGYTKSTKWGSSTTTKVIIEEKIAPTSTAEMFYNCSNLEEIENIENLHTENVTNMNCMFLGCNKLKKLDVSNFNTKKVEGMNCLFAGCNSITELDVSWFDTSNVKSNLSWMFSNVKCKNLDLSNFDTSKVTGMCCMFGGITDLESLDITNFNTSNVKEMNEMFSGCEKLKNINLSSFDTSNVIDTQNFLANCTSLNEIDLRNFDTRNVTAPAGMFQSVTATIKLGPNWNSSITAANTGYAGTSWNI